MMKKNTMILQLFFAAGMMFLCGCGGSAPEGTPPAERNALVLRMFHSMAKGDAVSAAAQTAKVRAYDPGNAYFSAIIEVQECNQLMASAQTALDKGDFAKAEDILEEARKRYPLQPLVAIELNRLRQLKQLRAAAAVFRSAGSVAERERALKEVRRQAELVRDPALTALCTQLQKQLDREITQMLSARKQAASPAPARKP